MRSILIPTDYEDDTLQALELSWRTSAEEQAKVVLLSISPMPDSITEYLSVPPNKDESSDKRNNIMKEWKVRESLLDNEVPLLEHHQYGAAFPILEQIMERYEINEIIVPYSFQKSQQIIHIEAMYNLNKIKVKMTRMPERTSTKNIKLSEEAVSEVTH